MKASIDNFSKQAGGYAKYRPIYPEELYAFILQQVTALHRAWDCGTGNGQVASRLAESFDEVYATDISEQQLAHAVQKTNIYYHAARAEQSGLPDNSIQLVTVAQALHWFDFEHFYKEVNRVAAAGATVAVWCYGLLQISPKLDEHLGRFYRDTLGDYWDKERALIDQAYATIPFPFDEMKDVPSFKMSYTWDLAMLEGYLNTWSSVQKYQHLHQINPVTEFIQDLKAYWGNETSVQNMNFPLHLRIGRIR